MKISRKTYIYIQRKSLKLVLVINEEFAFRKVEEIQAALSDSTQRIGKLNDEMKQNQEKAESEVENLLQKHQQDLKILQDQLTDAVSLKFHCP